MNQIVQENRKKLVDQVVQDMEQGRIFMWDTGYAKVGRSYNPISGKNYRGGNAVNLHFEGIRQHFQDPRWLTFKQAADHGWTVKKGEHGTHIEYWKWPDQEKPDGPLETEEDKEKWKQLHSNRQPIVKNYVVFNASQVEGIPELPVDRDAEAIKRQNIAAMDNMIQNSEAPVYPDQCNRNYYQPGNDEIHVMPREAFRKNDFFYATVSHEIAHSTGHENRLNRFDKTGGGSFGSPEYAKEELRAEITSMFLMEEYNLEFDRKHYENHAAYLESWIEALKNDPNELYRAAADAEKAVDYIKTHMIEKNLEQEDVKNKVRNNEVQQMAKSLRVANEPTFKQPEPYQSPQRQSQAAHGVQAPIIRKTIEIKKKTKKRASSSLTVKRKKLQTKDLGR